MDPHYTTPQYQLFFAAEDGDLEKLQDLVTQDAVDLDEYDDGGWTALTHAARNGHTECVRCLLNAGANPNCRNMDDAWSPLLQAIFASDPTSAALLINKGAALDIRDNSDNQTPLMWAAEWNEKECATLLVQAGAKQTEKNDANKTAFDIAEDKGYTAIVDVLNYQKHNQRNLRRYMRRNNFSR